MKKVLLEVKQHLLTAISYMLPLVVASGLLIAIGNLMGGQVVTKISQLTVPSAFTSLGVLGMGLLPSFIAGKLGNDELVEKLLNTTDVKELKELFA